MKRGIAIATAGVMAMLLTLAIGVFAQGHPLEKTCITFSGPVELPDLRLEAGTYVFRLADTAGRNVVQVLTQDEMDILGQWLFVQAERPEVTGETVIAFRETAEGTTPAIQYWYYPGEKIGKEFVYPRDQALRIAARTGATVQATEGEVGPESQITAVEAEAQTGATREEAEAAPSAEEAAAAAAEPEPAAEPAAPAEREDVELRARAEVSEQPQAIGTAGELPATASPLALSGLIGVLSLLGAAGIRLFRS